MFEDLVGFRAACSAFEGIQRDIDRHPAGDLARAQSADSVGDRSDGTENKPVFLTFRFPESDGILIVVTDRPS